MSKALKKIKKVKAALDRLEEKEDELFEELDEAIGELEFEEENTKPEYLKGH